MKVLAFSDLHLARVHAARIVEKSREADLVIAAGDFAHARSGLEAAMALLEGIAAPVVAVPGNGESVDELRAAAPEGWQVLHGQGVEIDGLRIFGLGYGVPVTPFGAWSCDLSEAQAEERLATCETAELLVTHSPPKGIADRTSSGQSVGSTAIRDAIARIQPKLALCGHVHDCWGEEGVIGQSRVVNLGPNARWFAV
jgi:Icc-related predicted phosphoesterase